MLIKCINNMRKYLMIFTVFLFVVVFIGIIKNTRHPIFTCIGATLVLLLLISGLHFFNDKKWIVNKKILIIMVFVIPLQLYVGWCLQVEGAWDFHIVYKKVQEYTNNGAIKNATYFARYPNNLFLFYILTMYSKALSWINQSLTLFNVIILNTLVIDIAIYFIYLIAKKFYDSSITLIITIICMVYSPFYVWTPFFYTDTLGMMFLIITVYFYISSLATQTDRKKIIYLVFTGIFAALSMKTKGNLIILIIAILLHSVFCVHIYKQKLKLYITRISFFILSTVIFTIVISINVNSLHVVNHDQFEKSKFPPTHWIMMGLNGVGNYNYNDDMFTRSFPNYSQKLDATTKELILRAKEKGILGILLQFNKKATSYGWNQGSFFVERYLESEADVPVHYTYLHKFVLNNGKYHDVFYIYTQSIWVCLLLCSIISMIACCKSKIDEMNLFVVFLNLIFVGTLLFFIIWETHPRYILHVSPLVILSAGNGLKLVNLKFKRLNIV